MGIVPPPVETGLGNKKCEAVSLAFYFDVYSPRVYLSATNGSRILGAVKIIVAKKADVGI
jgi:hypothetical protein